MTVSAHPYVATTRTDHAQPDRTPVDLGDLISRGGAAAQLAEICRLVADSPLYAHDHATTRTLALVCEVMPTSHWASLTRRAAPSCPARTIAASHACAGIVDAVQYRANEGPCLTALANDTVVVSDFTTETRWPVFTARALAETPACAAFSYPLAGLGHPGVSLNLYSDTADAFDGELSPVLAFTYAGVALALTAINQHRRADNLEIALQTSRRIGAAIGILMHRHRLTNEQAFDALRAVSQQSNHKLYEIAEQVLLTGELPRVYRRDSPRA